MGLLTKGKCKSKARLDGKTALITGGNNGIGFETALDLLHRGARVILACRSMDRANSAAERLRAAVTGAQVRVVKLNLASLKSVKECARELLISEMHIHLLINNAGMLSKERELTEDGYESTFQTNHLGHYLFTRLLLPKIKDSAPARIINVSSVAHRFGKIKLDDLHNKNSYDGLGVYSQSKLCNILFTLELQQRLRGTGVVVYSLHPGGVNTDILNDTYGCSSFIIRISRWSMKTPEEGAQTTIHCAVDENLAEQKALYYSDCKPSRASSKAKNKELAAKLWQSSDELVAAFL